MDRHGLFTNQIKAALERMLPDYLRSARWFSGKARKIASAAIQEIIALPCESRDMFLTLVRVEYAQGESEAYSLPLSFASGAQADQLFRDSPHLAIARLTLTAQKQEGIVYDAIGSKTFCHALLELVSQGQNVKGQAGDLLASNTPALRPILGDDGRRFEPSRSKGEQTNSSIVYGDRLILKLFRRLEIGTNPELEVGLFLTEKEFTNVPPLAGALEYRSDNGEVSTLAVLSGFVPGAKDAWEYTLDALSRYYERVQSLPANSESPHRLEGSLLELAAREFPASVQDIVGTYAESARLLGERTAALHGILASDPEAKGFVPEPFTPHYQRSLFQSMRQLTQQNFQLLRKRRKDLPESAGRDTQKVLGLEAEILNRFRSIYERPIAAMRIRNHGDFHLGQVLYTGRDFVIIDFEGEPARPLTQRRIKRSPLRDVAGMLRSFHYAAHAALLQQMDRGRVPAGNLPQFQQWMRFWRLWVSVAYWQAYWKGISRTDVLPKSDVELKILLDAFILEKAIYELGYELNNRPEWVGIPLQGILNLVEPGGSV